MTPMYRTRLIFSAVLIFLSFSGFSQATYLPEGSKDYITIERLQIKQGKSNELLFSTTKPFSRRSMVLSAQFSDSLAEAGEVILSPVDQYNLRSLYLNNREWVTTKADEYFESKKPVWNTFYKSPANLFEVNSKDFFLVINPVLNLQAGKGNDGTHNLFYNRRGIELRGRIADKIGFASMITDNQERGPLFFKEYVDGHRAVPGAGFYKPFKGTAYDYFDGGGYFTFNITKYIDVQFGYDKNFIGDGYRSLFLDNFGNRYLFLKLNTKIWKLNYQNLFMELMPQFIRTGDHLLDRKYAAMHHLNVDVARWLNLGLFEGVVFSRRNHFDFEYLNPIIFLRHVESALGSPDKAKAGFDFKANVAHKFQFYGQFLLDEFIVSEFFKNNGFWANKYGYQLGVKYIDAFKVKNLDLQFESNRIRPFTYTHRDSLTDYSHYNLPLAHPVGANLQEYIGLFRYQPLPKWRLDGRAIYYYQGKDTAGIDFGGDIFRSYDDRSQNYGYYVGDGRKVKVFNLSATLGYELKQNLFLEGNLLYRSETSVDPYTYFYVGLRWNAGRRDYNF